MDTCIVQSASGDFKRAWANPTEISPAMETSTILCAPRPPPIPFHTLRWCFHHSAWGKISCTVKHLPVNLFHSSIY